MRGVRFRKIIFILLKCLIIGLVFKLVFIDKVIVLRKPVKRDDIIPQVNGPYVIKKPVIYLYPEHKAKVYVKLEFKGKIVSSYPRYNNEIKGWYVDVYPDGTIVDLLDKKQYKYIFWEGEIDSLINWDFSEGFVVEGKNSRDFLQKILPQMGLIPKEYNEFISYWSPLLQRNRYNLIYFDNKEYKSIAYLTIKPKPDSILRIFMVYKPLDKPKKVKKQLIKPFIRRGFTVVEWGGTRVD